MTIRIDPHTLERVVELGHRCQHIRDVVLAGTPVIATRSRLAKIKVYDYHGIWKGHFYEQQLVRPLGGT